MAKTKRVLSKTQSALLEDLIDWAGQNYYQADRGTGSYVDKAKKNFEEAKAAMTKHLLARNNTIEKLRMELKIIKNLRVKYP